MARNFVVVEANTCQPGTYLSSSCGCWGCPTGTYQPNSGESSCISCT